jgi:hypothetical protein
VCAQPVDGLRLPWATMPSRWPAAELGHHAMAHSATARWDGVYTSACLLQRRLTVVLLWRSCWGAGLPASDPLSKVTPAIENNFKVGADAVLNAHCSGFV